MQLHSCQLYKPHAVQVVAAWEDEHAADVPFALVQYLVAAPCLLGHLTGQDAPPEQGDACAAVSTCPSQQPHPWSPFFTQSRFPAQ